jgi:hypothetical protein
VDEKKCENCLWWVSPEKGDEGRCHYFDVVESQAANEEFYPRSVHGGDCCNNWMLSPLESSPVGVGE